MKTASVDLPYFQPLLPWHQQAWRQVTKQANNQQLPHALLATGMSGIGKQAFVWRLVAWLLCQNRDEMQQQACGHCASCQWLRAGTHPNLSSLPAKMLPNTQDENLADTNPNTSSVSQIKIDDIRQIQDFVNQSSQGLRICVLIEAEKMTIAAANALLKTLEEPQDGVYFILVSDHPSKLLPTIKSRVQQLPLQTLDAQMVADFVANHMTDDGKPIQKAHVDSVLAMANYAPLTAVKMVHQSWYPHRELWLKTWLALRTGKRTADAAYQYWQKTISLSDFIELTKMMLIEIRRVALGLANIQQDIDFSMIHSSQITLSLQQLLVTEQVIAQIQQAIQQNVQEKLAYAKLMNTLASL